MPATNVVSERSFSVTVVVVSERSFSALKTYLLSTTGNSRLNNLTMLHVHKDKTDALTFVDLANDFVGEKENRGAHSETRLVSIWALRNKDLYY